MLKFSIPKLEKKCSDIHLTCSFLSSWNVSVMTMVATDCTEISGFQHFVCCHIPSHTAVLEYVASGNSLETSFCSHFMIPPVPSQFFILWLVAKKGQSVVRPKFSWGCKRLLKFIHFLYCDTAPSGK